MTNDADAVAENLIRSTGDRLTSPRVRVLVALLNAGRALTHSEIDARLSRSHGINRVTVYRVLEWLTQTKIAHKIAGDDRVWRFNVMAGEHGDEHPHFVCNACGRVLCLDAGAKPSAPSLPAGFQSQAVELTVKGLCDACSEHARRKSGARARRDARA